MSNYLKISLYIRIFFTYKNIKLDGIYERRNMRKITNCLNFNVKRFTVVPYDYFRMKDSNFSFHRSTRRSINYASEHEEENTFAFLSILRALARTVLHVMLPINVVRILTEQVENRGLHLLSILFSFHSTTRSHCRILKDRLREEVIGDFEWNLISLPAKEQIEKEWERERGRQGRREVTGLHPLLEDTHEIHPLMTQNAGARLRE